MPEHRKLRITDIISIAVSVVTLTTVVSSMFFNKLEILSGNLNWYNIIVKRGKALW